MPLVGHKGLVLLRFGSENDLFMRGGAVGPSGVLMVKCSWASAVPMLEGGDAGTVAGASGAIAGAGAGSIRGGSGAAGKGMVEPRPRWLEASGARRG